MCIRDRCRYNNKRLADEFTFVTSKDYHPITIDDLCNEIQKLTEMSQEQWHDGIPAEAINHAGNLLAVHLTLLYNMRLCHCYLPDELITRSPAVAEGPRDALSVEIW